jgi:hypothetical protein
MEAINANPPAYRNEKVEETKYTSDYEEEGQLKTGQVADAFGNEESAEIKYKTLKWWYVLGNLTSGLGSLLTIVFFGYSRQCGLRTRFPQCDRHFGL